MRRERRVELSAKEPKKPKTKKKPKWKKKKEAKGAVAEEKKGFEVVREDEKGVVVVSEEPIQPSVEKASDVTERQANSVNGEFATKGFMLEGYRITRRRMISGVTLRAAAPLLILTA